MANLLEVKNISKSFGDKAVLKDISFNVPAGSIVGFIGDNGAGKSTTFKSVLGLTSTDNGSVKILGKEDPSKHSRMKEEIGVVFDAMNLPSQLTIKQLGNVLKKMYDSWDTDNFNRLVEAFSLPLDKKVITFSRGMSMKLSVAIALSHDAKLLLLDEATGGLDPSSRSELLSELERFVREKNGGILLSSHIMSDVEKIASHLVFIKQGEIILNDEIEEVFEKYGLADVTAHQLSLIDEEWIVAKKDQDSHYRVLVSDKEKLPTVVKSKRISMEELTIFLTRSEK
ncbi:ABC transporter ATP-binding protein [Alteribacter aurantiacus]|uniref:ABC transporter ATP-binding protein n=1 Tax=Alteribacter aurantiacus TaxID=254410 RepID=UPI0004266342|nr:ABC transporter ATP-binding protein [Alteribacter aurantiacus]